MRLRYLFLISWLSSTICLGQGSAFQHGHSHNDYERERPLMDALDAGMSSIEIDIILNDDELIVAHDDEKFDIESTLEELYFKPIIALIKKRGGSLYPDKTRRQVQLLIDLKTEGDEILIALDNLVKENPILFDRRGLDKKWSPLRIVLSGEVNKDRILGSKDFEYFHVDGRCPDIKKNYPSYEMPLISEKYTKYFKWEGEGEPNKREVKKLKKMIKRVHEQDKKIRFWATKDDERVWKYLLDHGVDYINVDDPARFQQFMSIQ